MYTYVYNTSKQNPAIYKNITQHGRVRFVTRGT